MWRYAATAAATAAAAWALRLMLRQQLPACAVCCCCVQRSSPCGCCTRPAYLAEVERRRLAAVVVVAVHVQHLGGVAGVSRAPSWRRTAVQQMQPAHTFMPATDSRPLMMHSFRPVPSTMASYSWSMLARARQGKCWSSCNGGSCWPDREQAAAACSDCNAKGLCECRGGCVKPAVMLRCWALKGRTCSVASVAGSAGCCNHFRISPWRPCAPECIHKRCRSTSHCCMLTCCGAQLQVPPRCWPGPWACGLSRPPRSAAAPHLRLRTAATPPRQRPPAAPAAAAV